MKQFKDFLKKENNQLMLFSLSLQLVGYTFLVIKFGLLLAAILFVILWSNNIQISQNIKRK